MRKVPTQARIKELFRYSKRTGLFIRRVVRGSQHAGTVAGSKYRKSHISICVDRVYCLAHHLAWLYVTGKWPKHMIDHRNRDDFDNRWDNLRYTTKVLNGQNRDQCYRNNKTGYLGVSASRGKFIAIIHLGGFSTAKKAGAAYMAAKRKIHKGYSG